MSYYESTFNNKDGNYWATGRNGFTDKIKGLTVCVIESHYQRKDGEVVEEPYTYTDINVLTSRGEELHAGFAVPIEAFIDVAKRVLEAQGYKVEKNG